MRYAEKIRELISAGGVYFAPAAQLQLAASQDNILGGHAYVDTGGVRFRRTAMAGGWLEDSVNLLIGVSVDSEVFEESVAASVADSLVQGGLPVVSFSWERAHDTGASVEQGQVIVRLTVEFAE